jgi:hypothetical protein
METHISSNSITENDLIKGGNRILGMGVKTKKKTFLGLKI